MAAESAMHEQHMIVDYGTMKDGKGFMMVSYVQQTTPSLSKQQISFHMYSL